MPEHIAYGGKSIEGIADRFFNSTQLKQNVDFRNRIPQWTVDPKKLFGDIFVIAESFRESSSERVVKEGAANDSGNSWRSRPDDFTYSLDMCVVKNSPCHVKVLRRQINLTPIN